MPTPDWVEYTEKRYGVGSTGNEDTFNRACRTLWDDMFTVQHDKDGDHKADLFPSTKIEEGSYTGNGADDRNISLSDGTLDIKFMRVYSAEVAYTYIRTEGMAGDNTKNTKYNPGVVFQADQIQSVGTGTFQVGTNAAVNTNLATYYYLVVGE